MMSYYDKIRSKTRESLLAERTKKSAPRKADPEAAKALEPRVREIVAALDKEGRWVTRGHIQKRNWEFNDRIETEVFIKNTATLAAYVELAK